MQKWFLALFALLITLSLPGCEDAPSEKMTEAFPAPVYRWGTVRDRTLVLWGTARTCNAPIWPAPLTVTGK